MLGSFLKSSIVELKISDIILSSHISRVQGHKRPPWGASICSQGSADTEDRPCFATQASQKPGSAGDLSCSSTKTATKQGATIAPSAPNRGGGVLPQPASQRNLVNTRLTTSVRFCFLPHEKKATNQTKCTLSKAAEDWPAGRKATS